MHFMLIYELADDYLARRPEFRGQHLKLAWAAHDRGELVMGGAIDQPIDTAMLLFRGDSPQAAEDFARADPYVLNGLVRRWSVRPWLTVVGRDAANPVRPGS
ncbi:MAG: YciI-like protein [Candidatus Eisenbacteria bacterium]